MSKSPVAPRPAVSRSGDVSCVLSIWRYPKLFASGGVRDEGGAESGCLLCHVSRMVLGPGQEALELCYIIILDSGGSLQEPISSQRCLDGGEYPLDT